MTIRNADGEARSVRTAQKLAGRRGHRADPVNALLAASNLFLYDFDDLIDYLFKFDYLYVAYAVKNDVIICGEKSVGPYVALLVQAARLEIVSIDWNSIIVLDATTSPFTNFAMLYPPPA